MITGSDGHNLFGATYPITALIGGVYGLFISKKWGGYKSYMGRGIIFLSLGLLGECFGQIVWSYYNIIAKIDIPYPSLADIGYFSIIPLYILGMISLAKASGVSFSLKTVKGKFILVIIPAIMLTLSYFLYLKDLKIDVTQPIKTFLDYGYPIGEALTISIALLVYSLSLNVLGGKMKGKILFIILAFIIQYVTDSTFLYTVSVNTYYNGGPVDMMYATSFLAMAFGLIAFYTYDE
jgi:hypothetical protein